MKLLNRHMTFFILLVSLSSSAEAQWENMTGVYVDDITCMEPNGQEIFAGTDWGIYYSKNYGKNWVSFDHKYRSSTINEIVLEGSKLIVGAWGSVSVYNFDGEEWIRQTTSGVIYAEEIVVIDSNIFVAAYNGLYRSSDFGVSWEQIMDKSARSIILHNDKILAAVSSGISVSTNNGQSWEWQILDSENLNPILSIISAGDNLYARTHNLAFVSWDGGQNWNKIPDAHPAYQNGSAIITIPNLHGSLDYFAATGSGVYYSANNGVSWYSRNTGLPDTRVGDLVYNTDEQGKGFLIAGTNEGIFTSLNQGMNWNAVNSGIAKHRIISTASIGDRLFAGSEGGGLFYSEDNGDTWGKFEIPSSGSSIKSIIEYEDIIIAATNNTGIIRSTDGGDIWMTANSGLSNMHITSLKANKDYIFAGTYGGGIFRSSDKGDNWENTNSGLNNIYVSSLEVIGNYILMGELADGIYRSSDNGDSWVLINYGITDTYINCLETNGSGLFAGTRYGYIYSSTNEGEDWFEYGEKSTSASVNSLASYGKNLYAGTDEGVYLFAGNGTYTEKVDADELKLVFTITLHDNFIFSGNGNGLWRRPLSEITGIEEPENSKPTDYHLSQNYPNPFNISTQIVYSVPDESFITIKVYNSIGEIVETLFQGKRHAGTYNLSFDGDGLPTGVYLCQMKAGKFVQIKKLLLIK